MLEVNISLRPREAMFDTGKSLSPNKIKFCFEKILKSTWNETCFLLGFPALYKRIGQFSTWTRFFFIYMNKQDECKGTDAM